MGLEPTRRTPHAPQTCLSTIPTLSQGLKHYILSTGFCQGQNPISIQNQISIQNAKRQGTLSGTGQTEQLLQHGLHAAFSGHMAVIGNDLYPQMITMGGAYKIGNIRRGSDQILFSLQDPVGNCRPAQCVAQIPAGDGISASLRRPSTSTFWANPLPTPKISYLLISASW